MANALLAQLRADHVRFERFFRAIEDQCARHEAGHPVDLRRMKAIIAYLENCALPAHHAAEDALYAQLSVRLPRFGHDLLDLAEDHHASKLELRRFVRSAEGDGTQMVEAARSFAANERAHFISEEELLFPYAEAYLKDSEWSALADSHLAADMRDCRARGFEAIGDLLV